jgi:hypothetical protein
LSLDLFFVSVWLLLVMLWRCWGWCGLVLVALAAGLRRLYRRSGVCGGEEVVWCVWKGSGPGPDLELAEIGECRRLMFVCVLDPVLRGWWLLRPINAFWLGDLLAPRFVVDGACFMSVRAGGVLPRWREVEEDEGPLGFLLVYPPFMYLYLYAFPLCILTTA